MRGDVVARADAAMAADGRNARSPVGIPWSGWKSVLRRVWHELISDRISLTAAGCAFYATLSLFPAITMLISLYGLIFSPASVEPQLRVIEDFLPAAAYQLIYDRVNVLVTRPPQSLSIGLLVSFMVAFWSASTGTKAMLSALNVAYEETEKRGFIRFQLTAFAITLVSILGTVVGLALLLVIPAVIGFFGLSSYAKGLIQGLSFLLLVVFVALGLSLLYRYGASRRPAHWHWVTPGSAVATVLWLLASVLFSLYVGHVASYSATYGPIGAMIAVMMWFYVSAYVVLLGAELNAELELQTARDTTDGQARPMGARGAFVADHVAR